MRKKGKKMFLLRKKCFKYELKCSFLVVFLFVRATHPMLNEHITKRNGRVTPTSISKVINGLFTVKNLLDVVLTN